MKTKILSTLVFSVLSCWLFADSGQPATATFTLDQCTSFFNDGTNQDYSEFTADIVNSSDLSISVVNNTLYRNNPTVNGHSCTPGLNGTEAMCISYDPSCTYNPGSERSLRFDIEVTPTAGQPAVLEGLSFYELSPTTFDWIDGATGANNWATQYGLRVLKAGVVIYEQSGIATSQVWTLQNFDFSTDQDFIVSQATTFNFELLAYCPNGNMALQSVWDVEDIKVTASCNAPQQCLDNGSPVELDGGTLSFLDGSDSITACVGDVVFDVFTSSNMNEDYYYFVTDNLDNILAVFNAASSQTIDISAAPPGICHVWAYNSFGLTTPSAGDNISSLNGNVCASLSDNFLVVTRNQAQGGSLSGGPFTFDQIGDGIPDMIAAGSITLADNVGPNTAWVVTDANGVILGLPPMPSAVDFDGAGAGNCLIWHLSWYDTITGAEVGMNANDITGCWSLSNSIEVIRSNASGCDANGGALFGGPFTFDSTGDGVRDTIPAGSITLANANGANSQWVVTDANGIILGLPPMPSVVDFDGAGAGNCLIWHLSYDGMITGAEVGMNANDITGCWSLSNSIEVIRTNASGCDANGGALFGGPFTFDQIGDGTPDTIPAGSITLANANGANSQWVVTDANGIILGLPPMPSVVDFDGAGAGNCLIWHLSYDGMITGAEVGMNANDITGCWSLSNSIEVIRSNAGDCDANGGELFGGPFTFDQVGDGTPDMIPAGSITLANANGNSQWVVTDANGYILGLPPMPGVVDFDTPGAGNCLIYNVSYIDTIGGLAQGLNIADLTGCTGVSNSIEVIRTNADGCNANGGILFGGPFVFDSIGDGVIDTIPAGSITVANSNGNSQWVVTDASGIILGLPPMPSVVNFDGAGAGNCLIYHVSYIDTIAGLAPGNDVDSLTGCWGISNSIEVIRNNASGCQANGGELFGGPFTFDQIGDGTPDMIPAGSITVANSQGDTSIWVVTDDQGNILGLPPMPSAVDFDGAGAGVCLIWNLSYNGSITGAEVGMNANNIMGCFSLSNPVQVTRNNASNCNANGGELFGGPFTFDQIGDGTPDMIPAGSITLTNNSGANSQWVVTDANGIILGLPPMPSVVDFDGAGAGNCLIWHLSYEGTITGAEVGMNANDITGCWSLSNSIEVIRTNASGCNANGGELFGGPFTFNSIGDGTPDMIPAGSITLANANGMNSQWVVTDANGIILGLPPMPSVVDFDGAGAGNCLIWHLSYEGTITGAEVGMNANDITGCWSLSNSIEVIRTNASGCNANGGELFGGPFTFNSIGDGIPDMIPAGSITLANANGMNSQWVVTDDLGNILGLPPMPSAVDFDGAGTGVCFVYHLSHDGSITGLSMGTNINTGLAGCFSISNGISVTRSGTTPPTATSDIILNEIAGNGDVEILNIGTSTVDVSNYWLCNFPGYAQLSNLNLVCGTDLILAPGEFVTVNWNGYSSTDAEMGLYTSNQFGNSNAIIDYVEWGSTGHQRSSVAVAAGIWTTGDFGPSFPSAMSLEYDGTGDASSDWSQDMSTPCMANTTNVNVEVAIKAFPNPTSNMLNLSFDRPVINLETVLVFDMNGNLVKEDRLNIPVAEYLEMNVTELRSGAYYIRVISDSNTRAKRFLKID